jgi:hypothetical protein
MSRLLEQKEREKELRFRPIGEHSPVQKRRRICEYCGRLAYVKRTGQLVDYHFTTAKNVIGAPGIEVRRVEKMHMCHYNGKSHFPDNAARLKI